MKNEENKKSMYVVVGMIALSFLFLVAMTTPIGATLFNGTVTPAIMGTADDRIKGYFTTVDTDSMILGDIIYLDGSDTTSQFQSALDTYSEVHFTNGDLNLSATLRITTPTKFVVHKGATIHTNGTVMSAVVLDKEGAILTGAGTINGHNDTTPAAESGSIHKPLVRVNKSNITVLGSGGWLKIINSNDDAGISVANYINGRSIYNNTKIYNITTDKLYVAGSYAHGFQALNVTKSSFGDITAVGNTQDGIRTYDKVTENTFGTLHVYNNRMGVAVWPLNSKRNQISQIVSKNNRDKGVLLQGQLTSVSSIVSKENEYEGLLIDAKCAYCSVSSVLTVNNSQNATTSDAGVYSQANRVTVNNIKGLNEYLILNISGDEGMYQVGRSDYVNDIYDYGSDNQLEISQEFGDIQKYGTRTVVNGYGKNSGNPQNTGDWYNNGYPGVIVEDTSTNDLYQYSPALGNWTQIAP